MLARLRERIRIAPAIGSAFAVILLVFLRSLPILFAGGVIVLLALIALIPKQVTENHIYGFILPILGIVAVLKGIWVYLAMNSPIALGFFVLGGISILWSAFRTTVTESILPVSGTVAILTGLYNFQGNLSNILVIAVGVLVWGVYLNAKKNQSQNNHQSE